MPAVSQYLNTEASDRLATEASDEIILEQGLEITGTSSASTKPGRWQFQSMFMPLLPLVVATVPPLDSWIGNHPDLVFKLKEERYTYQNFFAPVNPPKVDQFAWQGCKPDLIFKPKEERYTYPNHFWSTFTPLITVVPTFYYPQYPDILYRTKDFRYTYPNHFAPILPPTPPNGGWRQPIDQKAREFPDLSYITSNDFLWDEALIGGWCGTWNFQDVNPFERLDNRWTFSSDHRTEKIDLRLNLWHPNIEQKVRELPDLSYIVPIDFLWDEALVGGWAGTWNVQDVNPFERADNRDQRSEYFIPLVTAVAETITLDKWFQQRPEFLNKLKDFRYTYPHLFAPITLPPTPNDGWLSKQQDIIFRIKEQRYLHQSTFFPERLSSIPLTSWLGIYPDIIYRAKNLKYLDPELFRSFVISPIEIITLDKWSPKYQDILFRTKDLRYLYPSLSFPEKLQPIPLTAWTPKYPDIIFRAKNLKYLDPELFRGFVIPPNEIITMDKWFVNTNQPRLDKKHPEYLFVSDISYIGKPIVQNNNRIVFIEGRMALRIGKNIYIFI